MFDGHGSLLLATWQETAAISSIIAAAWTLRIVKSLDATVDIPIPRATRAPKISKNSCLTDQDLIACDFVGDIRANQGTPA